MHRCERSIGWICFSMFAGAMGVFGVIFPLHAMQSGMSHEVVGLLVAVGAGLQFASRFVVAVMVRRLGAPAVLVAASLMMALSCAGLLQSSVAGLLGGQVLQGVARAFFWTGSQVLATHLNAVPVSAMRTVNLASGLGGLVGPIVAGLLWAWDWTAAAIFGAASALIAFLLATVLMRLGRGGLDRVDSSVESMRMYEVWGSRAVRQSCYLNGAAGAWRSLMDSYVPVLLASWGLPGGLIGAVVGVGNGAVLMGGAISVRIARRGLPAASSFGLGAAAFGLAAVGVWGQHPWVAAVCLGLSGLGVGVLQTVGPAMAVEAVPEVGRVNALTLAGISRAAALMAVPLGMSGLVTVLSVPLGVSLAGGLLGVAPLRSLVIGVGRRARKSQEL